MSITQLYADDPDAARPTEDDFLVTRHPVVAWRIETVEGEDDAAFPVVPCPPSSCVALLVEMPNGTLYSIDGEGDPEPNAAAVLERILRRKQRTWDLGHAEKPVGRQPIKE